MNQLLTKLVKYDPVTSEITFKVMFVNEEIVNSIFDLVGKSCKILIKGIRYKETTRDSTRRRWYQIIGHILKSSGITITKLSLGAFHHDMKESMFECETFEVDGKVIPLVPSINAIPDDQVKSAIELLIQRYSQIGVDFKEVDNDLQIR
jgi:hypothetical protein